MLTPCAPTVFTAGPDGAVRFHPLPPPWDDEVSRLLDQIARVIHCLVERHLTSRGDDPHTRSARLRASPRHRRFALAQPCTDPNPPAGAPRSSMATRSMPIASSTPTIETASSAWPATARDRRSPTPGSRSIGLSAAALLADTKRAAEAGFFRYLTKPVKVGELTRALEELLEPRPV